MIGDVAAHRDRTTSSLPGLATVAIQQARHVAKGIASGDSGATGPLRYFDKGALAVIGGGRAICAVRASNYPDRSQSVPTSASTCSTSAACLVGASPLLSKWASTAFGPRTGPDH